MAVSLPILLIVTLIDRMETKVFIYENCALVLSVLNLLKAVESSVNPTSTGAVSGVWGPCMVVVYGWRVGAVYGSGVWVACGGRVW